MTRMLDGLQNGGFGNLVEDDTVGLGLVQSQHLTQMPGDGFSLAVFIGCEPYFLCLLRVRLQFADESLLVIGDFVFRLKGMVINAEFFLLQVPDMTVARHDFIVITQEFLYRLRLGGRLYNYEVLLHIFVSLY